MKTERELDLEAVAGLLEDGVTTDDVRWVVSMTGGKYPNPFPVDHPLYDQYNYAADMERWLDYCGVRYADGCEADGPSR